MAGSTCLSQRSQWWERSPAGRKHLGKIQRAAQALTGNPAAVGPLILAETVSRTAYATIFYLLTVVVLTLAVLAWFVPRSDSTSPICVNPRLNSAMYIHTLSGPRNASEGKSSELNNA